MLEPLRGKWLGLSHSRRGVLAIVGGTAGAQLVAALAAPVLSRLYTPAEFGVFTVLLALITTLGTFAGGRFESAIPLPQDDEEGWGLGVLCLIAAVVTMTVGLGVVFLVLPQTGLISERADVGPWLWVVPVMAAVMAAYAGLHQLAVRRRRYSLVGQRMFLQSGAMVTVQTATGVAGLGAGGLLVGYAAGQLAGAGALLRDVSKGPEGFSSVAPARLRSLASRYRRFPLVLAPAGLLNTLGLQLPLILVTNYFGTSQSGQLGMATRILALPVALVGTAVAQVFLGELAMSYRIDPRRAQGLFLKATRNLVLVALGLLVALLLLAEFLFPLVLGNQWGPSGEFARALAPSLAAQMVAAPLGHTLIVLERQFVQLAWDVTRLVLTGGVMLAVIEAGWSARTAVATFAIVSAAMYVAMWLICWRSLKQDRGQNRLGSATS